MVAVFYSSALLCRSVSSGVLSLIVRDVWECFIQGLYEGKEVTLISGLNSLILAASLLSQRTSLPILLASQV